MTNCAVFVIHRVVSELPQRIDDVPSSLLEKWLDRHHAQMPKLGEEISFEEPKWQVLLTFDDGNQSDFNIVIKLLKKYSVNALFFIVPEYLGKKGFTSQKKLKEMSDMGFLIGSHSYNHPDCSFLDEQEFKKELRISKQKLSQITGMHINYFAFPYGLIPSYFNSTLYNEYLFYFGSKPGILNIESNVISRCPLNSKSDSKSITNIMKSITRPYSIYMIKFKIKEFLKSVIPKSLYGFLRNTI